MYGKDILKIKHYGSYIPKINGVHKYFIPNISITFYFRPY